MPTYEMMVVLDGQLADDDLEAQLTKIDKLITDGGGEITLSDTWGKRRMAYPIRRKVDGFYAVRRFTHPGPALPLLREIERAARIEEALLRHLVISIPKTKKPIPHVSRPEAADDARPDWGGARRGWRPPRPERAEEEGRPPLGERGEHPDEASREEE